MPAPLIVLGAAAVVASAAVYGMLRFAPRLPHALPSERSLHERPIPRVGGIALWLAAMPIALIWPPDLPGSGVAWLVAWIAVAAVSLADDCSHVGVGARLAVHVASAVVLAVAIVGGRQDGVTGVAAIAGATLLIAWGMNLYNFMDGSDGLAATMAIAGFGAYAAGLATAGEPWLACAALAVGAAAFLAANRPPASLFLGDVGAVPLGMLAAAVGLAGTVRGTWPAWFPLLAFLPFVLDASVTLARRLLKGERIAQAHRSHYYQRLLQLGFGHAGTLAVYGALMVSGAVAAVGCLRYAQEAGPWALALFCATHAVLFATIDYHWAKRAESR